MQWLTALDEWKARIQEAKSPIAFLELHQKDLPQDLYPDVTDQRQYESDSHKRCAFSL